MRTLLWSMFCLSPLWATAQIDDAGMELLKPFRAKLAESKKFNATPILPKLDTQATKNLDYTVPTHLKELAYPAPTIRPLAAGEQTKAESYNFYAKAGFGYPISPLLELSYHSKPSNSYKYGATYRHHSGRGNYNDNQRFSTNAANVNGTYFLNNGLAIGGDIGFNLDGVRFYGYGDSLDTDTSAVPKDSVQQRFTEFNMNVAVFNGRTNKLELNYKGRVGMHVLSDKFQTNEFSISPDVVVEKWFGKTKKHALNINTGLNYVTLKDSSTLNDTISKSRMLVYFNPTFNYNAGVFRAKVGANLGTSETKFYVYPDVEVLVNLLNGKANIYAGWRGAVRQNNFRSLTRFNPYIVSTVLPHHTNQQDIYGGIKGSIKKINYDVKASYSIAQNLPFYLNDSMSAYRRFNVVFDTATIFSIQGAADMEIVKGLVFGATVGVYTYSVRQLDKAYHMPTLESNFNLQYQWKQLQAKAEFYVNSGVPYFDEATRTNKVLNGLFDFNLGASYYFTNNIAAFAQLNNLLNNQNQRWFKYPQIGFNAMAGVIARF